MKGPGVTAKRACQKTVTQILLIALASAAAAPQSAPLKQRVFATPQEAAQQLIAAAENFDVPTLLAIFGEDGKDLVLSGNAVEDKNRAAAFSAQARTKNSVSLDPSNPGRAWLLVGNEAWPLPVPIVEKDGTWSFDSKAGRDEILFRRIGENELNAIQVCRGFVEAQHQYALEINDGSDIAQYAQRIIATTGTRDGLAWQNQDGTWEGPIGEKIARALEQGYNTQAQPYHGYYFKILKAQGPHAPFGEMDFVVNGLMIGGFALAAAPAQYRVTGVATFIVSHDGIVYQKDLGPDTLAAFAKMDRYDPDPTWHSTDDQW